MQIDCVFIRQRKQKHHVSFIENVAAQVRRHNEGVEEGISPTHKLIAFCGSMASTHQRGRTGSRSGGTEQNFGYVASVSLTNHHCAGGALTLFIPSVKS